MTVAMLEKDASTAIARSRWPRYEEDEVEAVTSVLNSGAVNSLHHGTQCRAFEAGMCSLSDTPYAISLANGTLALELAVRALGVGPGDEVIVPARSFMASASCVVTCGAYPVFADVDFESQNLTAATISTAITPRTKAIIVVHLAGWPCDMEAVCALAKQHGVFVIEDCAQAHGAAIAGRPVGGFGDAGAFSFCTDKIMSTGGEGGALTLKDRVVWSRAWAFKDHGKDPDEYAQIVPGPDFLWLHGSVGSNYRMTEMQAAIGNAQLAKLARWIAARRANAAALEGELEGLEGLRLCRPAADIEHARYKYYAFVKPERLKAGWSRRRIVSEITAAGVPCSTGSCPEIYLEAAFQNYTLRPAERLPIAKLLGETSLMFQIDHTLQPDDLRVAGRVVRAIIEEASA